jgi:hypothetical protein
MVISAIGRIAAKAAIKKISNASAKKARAAVKADRKKTDFKAIEAMKTAEGTKGSSKLFNKKMTAGILPAASGEKFIGSLSEKQLGMLSKNRLLVPLLSQKVKRKVQDALDRFKKPSRQKGGGMATRGMGAALRGGGMALRGMGAAYKKK